MRKEYSSLSAFYRDFEVGYKGDVSLEDIDALILKLKSEKNAEVIELPQGSIIVQIPNTMSSKHLRQKKHNRVNYTKLSVSIRKKDAAMFSEACRKLGVTQTDVIMPVLRETIVRADLPERVG
jgi:hypothetical protein